MTSSKSYPWKNGYWYSDEQANFIVIVENDKVTWKKFIYLDYPEALGFDTLGNEDTEDTWTYGNFGPVNNDDILKMTGVQNYNLILTSNKKKTHGVLNKTGTQVHFLSTTDNKINILKWLDKEELEKIKNDRDPLEAPSCPYFKIQPDRPGKLIWLSGPPGSGKTTSAQMLGRNHDYKVYEADCYIAFKNPLVDPNDKHPFFSMAKKKPMKGFSKEAVDANGEAVKIIGMLAQGKTDGIEELYQPMLYHMGQHISSQKKRLGGDMVIAQSIFSRKQRDSLRNIIGPDLVFIVLNMSNECQMQRLKNRHGNADAGWIKILNKFHELSEPAEEDEENAFNVNITDDMSPEFVLQKILEIISILK